MLLLPWLTANRNRPSGLAMTSRSLSSGPRSPWPLRNGPPDNSLSAPVAGFLRNANTAFWFGAGLLLSMYTIDGPSATPWLSNAGFPDISRRGSNASNIAFAIAREASARPLVLRPALISTSFPQGAPGLIRSDERRHNRLTDPPVAG